MRSLPVYFALLVAVALMGFGLKVFPFQNATVIASEIAREEIASLNAAAPKFPRKPLLPGDVKVLLDKGHGSGVHIGNGWFLTAAHVVADKSKRLDLRFKDGSIRKAEVLWVSKERDIALLRADGDGVSFARLSCSMPAVGDDVTLAGNPIVLENITAFGKIAGEEREMSHWKSVVVISGPIIPGQSGGAVYNRDHEVVGITVGLALWPLSPFAATATGYGYAVPGKTICQLLARS